MKKFINLFDYSEAIFNYKQRQLREIYSNCPVFNNL